MKVVVLYMWVSEMWCKMCKCVFVCKYIGYRYMDRNISLDAPNYTEAVNQYTSKNNFVCHIKFYYTVYMCNIYIYIHMHVYTYWHSISSENWQHFDTKIYYTQRDREQDNTALTSILEHL